jgi:cellulose synthase/poly-beta-1,6-N-acetylglucosamine synthase-like glycosyltransferase
VNARPGIRWLFWGSAGVVAQAYVVFPAAATARALLRPRPLRAPATAPPAHDGAPAVSVVVAAHDEAGVIGRKLDNTLALDYPRSQLEVLVASDGSTDATEAIVDRCPAPEVRLLALPRGGKNAALNSAVRVARGEILVFTDADAMLHPDALRRLVEPFADPVVGAVAGERRQAGHGASARKRALWSAKRALREALSRAGSATAAEGQIHAIRRELFRDLPRDVNDDFYISAQAVLAGRRLVYAPGAVSEPFAASTALSAPFARKVRLTRRWLRAVWRLRRLLNPFEHGFYALQLLCHKLLRRLVALPLLALAATTPALWHRGRVYRLAAVAQALLHGGAAAGLLLRRNGVRGPRLLRAALRFDMANAAALAALVDIARGADDGPRTWTPQRPSAPAAEPDVGPVDPVPVRGDTIAVRG